MPSLKSLIIDRALSQERLLAKRRAFERNRRKSARAHDVLFFHDGDDPYSRLLASLIPEFEARYAITITPLGVRFERGPDLPELGHLRAYAKEDAAWLAAKFGRSVPGSDPLPNLEGGQDRLTALGHYQGGMLYYGGEWYWGVDRLHFLEARLKALGLMKPPRVNDWTAPALEWNRADGAQTGGHIDIFMSLRSPYSYLAMEQIFDLARAHGASTALRPVLPMIMRGYQVGKGKRIYIASDAARQARLRGLAFGRIADPAGRATERGMAILHSLNDPDQREAFCRAFLRAVWSEGIDAGRDKGLAKICAAAGLDWNVAKTALGREDWREAAAKTAAELSAHGLWGVPSFIVNGTAIWGEDRLARVQDVLKAR